MRLELEFLELDEQPGLAFILHMYGVVMFTEIMWRDPGTAQEISNLLDLDESDIISF